ncbi:hypothetical protein U9M48_023070 [Paspalum notatum var. saurae]|uniref:Uncharacterized protein n=1 Tax=Paspalum notatum var. saurae TaxID=547442 RepID=A0AAQ3TPL4_PASNO
MVAAAAIGTAAGVLQIPVAVYLIGKSRRRVTPRALIVDTSFWTDMVLPADLRLERGVRQPKLRRHGIVVGR